MNKKELVKEVASRVGNTQKNTQDIIETACEVIAEAIANEERVSLNGFGHFDQKTLKKYEFYSKSLRKEVTVPERRTVRFTPSEYFRKIL